MIGCGYVDIAHYDTDGADSLQNSALPTGGARVSGRASAPLGGAGRSLASHRLPLDGPTYYKHTADLQLRSTCAGVAMLCNGRRAAVAVFALCCALCAPLVPVKAEEEEGNALVEVFENTLMPLLEAEKKQALRWHKRTKRIQRMC
jgi:hypothetical protein